MIERYRYDCDSGVSLMNETSGKMALWIEAINELALKADHVAVLVVDAMCSAIGTASADMAARIFDEPPRSLSRKMKAVAFTDTTAPLCYKQYWASKDSATLMLLESTSRVLCQYGPRARFPDAPYAQALRQITQMHELFVARLEVDVKRDNFNTCKSMKEALLNLSLIHI